MSFLTVIIPIYFYVGTGDKKWNLSPNFKNRKLDNLYTKDILNFSYEYINIFLIILLKNY